MADIFVSYAREDRRMAEVVAEELEEAGFSVWWDRDLVPADDFRHEVDRQLGRARTLLVVWTHQSIASKWVLAEADHAYNDAKAILAVHASSLNCGLIPKPFGQFNSVPFENRTALLQALHKHGIGPVGHEPAEYRHAASSTVYVASKGKIAAATTAWIATALIFLVAGLTAVVAYPSAVIPLQALADGSYFLFALFLFGIYACELAAIRGFILLATVLTAPAPRIASTNSEGLCWWGSPTDLVFRPAQEIRAKWKDVSWTQSRFGFVCLFRERTLFWRPNSPLSTVPTGLLLGIASRTERQVGQKSKWRPRWLRFAAPGPEVSAWLVAYAITAMIQFASDTALLLMQYKSGATAFGNDWAINAILNVLPTLAEAALTARVLKQVLIEFPTFRWWLLYLLPELLIHFGGNDEPLNIVKEIDEISNSMGVSVSARPLVFALTIWFFVSSMTIVGNLFGCLQAFVMRRQAAGLPSWIFWSGLALASFVTKWALDYASPVENDVTGLIEGAARSAMLVLLHGALMLPAVVGLRRRRLPPR